MSKIACDQRSHCSERLYCGATLPHTVGVYSRCMVEETARYEEVVIMPKALTAENGAKALLIGEFNEEVTLSCLECDGSGVTYSDEVDEECGDVEVDCEICGGSGEHIQKVPVS